VADGGWSWAAIVAIAIVPIVLTAATAFAKSSVFLGALRVGLGAETLLPLPVVIALAIVVTAVIMAPTAGAVLGEIDARGGIDALAGAEPRAWLEAAAPWSEFLARHADADELGHFAELQGRAIDDPLVLVPAFLTTELREALQMAVVILVPLVVVDLLVAHAVALLGLVQMPVQLVSVPLKLLLFLAVGGWDIVLGGLIEGYR
jgi:flagellar biosynthesis protein FliP